MCQTCKDSYINQNQGLEINILASMRNKGDKLNYPGYRRILE